MYCMFWSIAAIIRYIELLQSLFFLSAMPPYTGQCLHFWSALYGPYLSAIQSKNCLCTCVLFRDRPVSLYSSNFVVNEEILRAVCNTGSYCSSDKVGTVYLVQYTFENSTVNLSALCSTCEDMACRSSWRFFIRAITSIMWSSSSSRVSSFLLYTLLLTQPHKQKSNGDKSEDLSGQLMVQPQSIHRLRKVSLRC
jgi:hypothetical protein